MIRAILFDLDNTLLDRDQAFEKFCHELLERFWPGLNDADRSLALARMAQRDQAFLMRNTSPNATPLKNLLEAAEVLGRDEFQDWPKHIWSEAFDAEKRRRLPQLVELNPGVQQLIRRLHGRFRMGIVTNGSSRVQREKLKTSKMDELFEHIVISEEIGFSKPDPRIFHAALSQIGCTPSETLFVGDDPLRDMIGAKQVGMRVGWVRRNRNWACQCNENGDPLIERPDYQMNDIIDLEESVPCLTPIS